MIAAQSEIRDLANRILANAGLPRVEFLSSLLNVVIECCDCDAAGLRLKDGRKLWSCEARRNDGTIDFEVATRDVTEDEMEDALEQAIVSVINGTAPKCQTTERGSYWTDDATLSRAYRSLAFLPLTAGMKQIGLLLLKREGNPFDQEQVEYCEQVAESAAIGLANHRTQAALRERVKEITCLYRATRLEEDLSRPLPDVLQGIAELLPPAWQYPEFTSGRIVLEQESYSSGVMPEGAQFQRAEINFRGQVCGFVEVAYAEDKPELDEGPFLEEERSLLDAIATQIEMLIERRHAEEDTRLLQEQLRHADRLATIGQLAAGMAHELNEPLGNILGFAQLVTRQDLSEQVERDVSRIVASSLQAREIIRKLMLFARQTPPKTALVDINQIAQDGLFFLERRCAKEGITLERVLSPDTPEIVADGGQLLQALVNLVVNAIQAMPNGGQLRVETQRNGLNVDLLVSDNGVGMSEEVLQKIFVPFFTTKDVDEGTGLGLSVVESIVESHGGSILAQSRPGEGSQFTISLPIEGPKQSSEARGEGNESMIADEPSGVTRNE